MAQIECTVFRKSGKYYTDEIVYIRDKVDDYDVPRQVYENRQIEDMIYVGKSPEHKIPFLVPAI